MTFSLYGTTFVDSATPVPAAFLNKMRTELPSAVDGRGGSYTNTSLLKHTTSGAGFTIDGDSLITLSSTGGLSITAPVSGTIPYAASSVTGYLDLSIAHAPDAVRWVFESANPTTLSTVPVWTQQASGADYPLLIPMRLPAGATITAVTALVDGNAGGLPGTPPVIELGYHTRTSSTFTSIASQSDTAADMTAYNISHNISLTGLTEVVALGRQYWARFKGEAGIFSGSGLVLQGVSVALSITSQTKWYG